MAKMPSPGSQVLKIYLGSHRVKGSENYPKRHSTESINVAEGGPRRSELFIDGP